MTAPIDLPHLRQWIGHSEMAEDTVSPRLVSEYTATFAPHGFMPEGVAPLGLHWCLAPPALPASQLGHDGHPAKGGFLPPVPLARRMWAGGEITFIAPLKEGDPVTRHSEILDVVLKEGRAGPMVIASALHSFTTPRGLAIKDRQEIVYLTPKAPPTPATGTGPKPAHRETVAITSTLLFRYSALTFNGHRIHYDLDFCREVEGYPDLVTHGPLQAAMLLNFGARLKGLAPQSFRYRSHRPLFGNEPLVLNASQSDTGLEMWTSGAASAPAMQAEFRL